MNIIDKTLLNASKNVSFNSDAIDVSHMLLSSFIVTTSSASSLNFSAQLQASNDATNYVNIGTAQTLNADGSFIFEEDLSTYKYTRVAFTRTGGSATFKIDFFAKG